MFFETDWTKVGAALCLYAALALSLLTSIPVHAQVSGATITGTVSDASGAIIPNAQISIKNVATGHHWPGASRHHGCGRFILRAQPVAGQL